MDSYAASNPVYRKLRRLGLGERIEEAVAFIRQFGQEHGIAAAQTEARAKEVRRSLRERGHYDHTAEELVFGARLAWRNHARCIGRLTWKSLIVHDCRHLSSAHDVLSKTIDNVQAGFRDGRIAASITIFAPATASALPATFESRQLFQYAGYLSEDGTVIGDRLTIPLTNSVMTMGWTPPAAPAPFDLLPVVLRDPNGSRQIFRLERELAREVMIEHPDRPGLAALKLRWYAVPVVTDMVLTIGGIDYPTAPFHGYYMGTEIASRDLTDERRYDYLPRIARALELDERDPLWRDTALTELNRAVLESYRQAGVRIIDHHEASRQFMEFVRQEQRAGRTPSADWAWIVPPQASAATPVFHLPMSDLQAVPNFYNGRQSDGGGLALDRSHFRESKWRRRYEREKRRWRDWRRQRDRLWHRA